MLNRFAQFCRVVSNGLAHPITFIASLATVIIWALCGPIFAYSAEWQLVINTGTTILTFLAVFLIQNTQNRDAQAMHLKLDELLRAARGARNELIDLEDLTEEELARYRQEFSDMHRNCTPRPVRSRRGSRHRRRKRSSGQAATVADAATAGAHARSTSSGK